MTSPVSIRKKRLLLTNDDGLQAPGLKALEDALRPLGDIAVVAPDREMSGTSQSLTLYSPLRVHAVDERHFSVSGTPADAVILALHRLLAEPPDLVVSGINPGGNMGENVVYSGTVGAAMEAAINHVPAIAVSIVYRGKHFDYQPAVRFVERLAPLILKEGLPR